MIYELIAFSNYVKFSVVFLRKPSEFYKEDIAKLKSNGIEIVIQPASFENFLLKFRIIVTFFFKNLFRFKPGYNSVVGFKSMLWFLRLDLTKFSSRSCIHAQFATQAALIALLIKKYYNSSPEYSFTFHAYDIYFDNKWFSLLVTESKRTFSISQYNINYVNKKYKNFDINKIKLSRLGVFRPENLQNQKVKKNGAFTLGLLSWFVEKKGIKYLLEAMKLINEGNNVKLILAGDGPLKEYIIDYINANELRESIDYIGRVQGQKKGEFFDSLDVFVLPAITLPNDQDGIPVVLMEAISYGLPLISTTVSGIPEICKNDYNGFLVPERDVNALVNAIYSLMENQDHKRKFSKNSLELSVIYDIELNSEIKLKYLSWL
jgi:glycosyltransferase involved in cell wall biosynthesis